jgi:hypothetical protein
MAGAPSALPPGSHLNLVMQVRNEVVIWDRIVRRKEDAQVTVLGKNKYVFRELSASFKCVSSCPLLCGTG